MVVGPENTGAAMRRSTRVPAEIDMRVRSLDPGFQFENQCKTLLVNAQGCGFQCRQQIPVGIAVLFTIGDRQVTATVLNATALGDGSGAWIIGAKLHRSGNFWGLASPPADWVQATPLPREPSTLPASVDQDISDKVTAEIQRQSELAMAGLRAQVEKLVAAREADFLARIVRESSVTSGEIARRSAEQESVRVRETFETLSRQFHRELEEHSARQTAEAEERLKQVQLGLSNSAEARFQAVTQEIVQKMRQDAK